MIMKLLVLSWNIEMQKQSCETRLNMIHNVSRVDAKK